MELSRIVEYTELYVSVFNSAPWNDSWTKETAQIRIEDMMKTPAFIENALYADNDLIGMIRGQKKQYYNGMHFHIQEFCVKTSEQNKGFGSMLLKALEKYVKEHINPGRAVSLELISSKEAVCFYKKHGFEERPCDWDGPGMFRMIR